MVVIVQIDSNKLSFWVSIVWRERGPCSGDLVVTDVEFLVLFRIYSGGVFGFRMDMSQI